MESLSLGLGSQRAALRAQHKMLGRGPKGGEVASEGVGAGSAVTLHPCFGGHVVYSHWSWWSHGRGSGVVRSA